MDLISDIFCKHKEDDKKIADVLMEEVFKKVNPASYYSNIDQSSDYVDNYTRKGLEYTIKKHKGQLRDSGVPYASHPVQCGYLIAEFGLRKEIIISAFLHDALEENKETVIKDLRDIKVRFGKEVGEYIFSMSIFEDGEDKDENHINNLWFASQNLDEYIRFYLYSADGISNLYTKKYMLQKNGLTAQERQKTYETRAEKNLLPVAGRIDGLRIIDLNLYNYIKDLIRR